MLVMSISGKLKKKKNTVCVCSSARLCVCAAAVIPQLIMSYFQLENNAAFMVSAAALLGLGGDDSHGWIIASARPFFQVHLSVPFFFLSYLGNTFDQILPVFCIFFSTTPTWSERWSDWTTLLGFRGSLKI